MSEQLTIHDPQGNPVYRITIDKSFDLLPEEVRKCGLAGKRCLIVTDTNVGPLYGGQVSAKLAECGCSARVFAFPAGEVHKNLENVSTVYRELIERKYDRSSFIAALGGGVAGDLAGYAAATYLRGIPFIQIPTTLLAQSDSSVGGKTGVDFEGYKNMIGAFAMPRLVFMNTAVMATMDERAYLSGMGEVVKHGYIRDPGFSEFIRSHTREILSRDSDTLIRLDLGNCRIKGAVVEEDPEEKGLRRILNFGHTLGHAIEKQKAGSLWHGECVAIGMTAAVWISEQRGLLPAGSTEKVRAELTGLRLPVQADFDIDAALDAVRNDKKVKNGKPVFILLSSFGNAFATDTVTFGEMRAALEQVCRKA